MAEFTVIHFTDPDGQNTSFVINAKFDPTKNRTLIIPHDSTRRIEIRFNEHSSNYMLPFCTDHGDITYHVRAHSTTFRPTDQKHPF